MKRLKSIDTFRGICMFLMVYGHLFDWWLKIEDYWFFNDFLKPLLGPIGAVGFVFISGISTGLSFKKNSLKTKNSGDFSMRNVRDNYLVRALLLLLIALIYNLTVAIRLNDFTFIWAWLILQTLSISLLISYPLLKFSRVIRLVISIVLLVGNQFFLWWLIPYKGQPNLFGVLFHILYNPVEHYVIVPFFSVFLSGTAIGDLIFDSNLLNPQINRSMIFKRFIFYMILFGSLFTFIGIFYYFPSFFIYGTYSSIIYAFGITICLFAVLFTLEKYEILKTKKSYRYLYYYSYYSFSIYIVHNLLYFLFVRQLSVITIWIPVLLMIPLLGLLLKMIYKHLGMKASLKTVINVTSFLIVKKIRTKNGTKKKVS